MRLRPPALERPCGISRRAGPPDLRLNREREALHPRAHRRHRAQPRAVHAPHDRQLVPGRARRTQHALLRGVGDGRLDRRVAPGREPVGARRLERPRRQLRARARRRGRAGSVAGRVVGGRGGAAAGRLRPHRRCPNRGARRSRSSPRRARRARCTPTSWCELPVGGARAVPRRARRRPAASRSEASGLECVGGVPGGDAQRHRGHRDLGRSPDLATWAAFEQAWDDGTLAAWRTELADSAPTCSAR